MKAVFEYPKIFNTVKYFKDVKNYVFFTLFLMLFSGCTDPKQQQSAPPPPQLPIKMLSKSDAISFQDFPAAIQGTVDIEIRPQVSGNLQAVLVEEGAFVTAGQTLFKINDRPFIEALNNAKASLQASEANLTNAQLEVAKLSPLVENKVVSDFQLQTAKAAVRVAQANQEQARAQVGTAQINLAYTNVKTMVSGYIGRIPRKQGSLVSPSDPIALTQLSDSRAVRAYFSLSENDFNSFNSNYPGNSPADRLNHLPEVQLVLSDDSIYPVPGHIDMIDAQFDKNTGSISMRATFTNPNGSLRSGNTGKIRLGLQHNNVIRVPQSATLDLQDKILVFTVDRTNQVKKVPITIAGKVGNDYLASKGLLEGDVIVLTGIDKLQEGQIIQPLKEAGQVVHVTTKK